MARKDDYIAVFDSGVGGISVLRELVKLCPQEQFLYFGDSANAPYGEKSTDEVRSLTLRAAEHLLSGKAKALVVACNTATAAAIGQLRELYPDTIIIGIEPALKMAADRFPTGRIGIMATKVTLQGEKLSQQLSRFPQTTVVRIPAPGLVELIEQGKATAPETKALLQQILAPYQGQLDALVLGCTHYPFVADVVAEILQIPLFDGSEGTARRTRQCLQEAGLLSGGPGSVTIENSSFDPRLIQLSFDLLEA